MPDEQMGHDRWEKGWGGAQDESYTWQACENHSCLVGQANTLYCSVNLCLKLSYSARMSMRTSVVRTNGASPESGAGSGPLLFLPKRDRAAV